MRGAQRAEPRLGRWQPGAHVHGDVGARDGRPGDALSDHCAADIAVGLVLLGDPEAQLRQPLYGIGSYSPISFQCWTEPLR